MKDISNDVIGAAIEVHKHLGAGLLESCYEKALKYELELRGHNVKQQKRVPIIYKGIDLSIEENDVHHLRFDLIVDDCLIIEIKSVEALKPVHFKQVRTYLHFLNIHIGLLLNFNVSHLMSEGFARIVDGFEGEVGKL